MPDFFTTSGYCCTNGIYWRYNPFATLLLQADCGGSIGIFRPYSFKSAKVLTADHSLKPVSKWLLAVVGSILGLLSGLTGVGGGVFLSPILLFSNWASPKVVAGIASAFILVNSISVLLGLLMTGGKLPY